MWQCLQQDRPVSRLCFMCGGRMQAQEPAPGSSATRAALTPADCSIAWASSEKLPSFNLVSEREAASSCTHSHIICSSKSSREVDKVLCRQSTIMNWQLPSTDSNDFIVCLWIVRCGLGKSRGAYWGLSCYLNFFIQIADADVHDWKSQSNMYFMLFISFLLFWSKYTRAVAPTVIAPKTEDLNIFLKRSAQSGKYLGKQAAKSIEHPQVSMQQHLH